MLKKCTPEECTPRPACPNPFASTLLICAGVASALLATSGIAAQPLGAPPGGYVLAPGVAGGTSDDAAALQAAQDAASAAGGGLLWVGSGPVRLNRSVFSSSGNTWFLSGGSIIGPGGLDAAVDGSQVVNGVSGVALMRSVSIAGPANTLYVSQAIRPTNSTANYQKNALMAVVRTTDPSSYSSPSIPTVTRDAVAAELRAIIGTGNATGRAVAAHLLSAIEKGGDGSGSGMEIELENGGTWQPSLNTYNTKIGLLLTCHGTANCTAAQEIGPGLPGLGTGTWGDGLVIRQDGIANRALRLVSFAGGTVGDLAYLDRTGAALFADVAIGGTAGKAAAVRATGTEANVSLAHVPKGTGANTASVPDGTAGGGNGRGANATDWSTSRSAAAQVASGAASVVGGGADNTADGDSSAIPGGRGASARARYGVMCHASGFAVVPGDAQECVHVLRATTRSTTPVRVTADGETPGAANIVNIPAGTAYGLKLSVVARDLTEAGNSVAWDVPLGLLVRDSRGTSYTGASPAVVSRGAGGSAAISLAADPARQGLNLTWTAPNADTWHVAARVISTEVQ